MAMAMLDNSPEGALYVGLLLVAISFPSLSQPHQFCNRSWLHVVGYIFQVFHKTMWFIYHTVVYISDLHGDISMWCKCHGGQGHRFASPQGTWQGCMWCVPLVAGSHEAASVTLLNPFTSVHVMLPPTDRNIALASFKSVSMVDGLGWVLHYVPGVVKSINLKNMWEVFYS
uniref:Uncharacterized protein n=1 Tax=Leersia perrieri TaxID=77586 RepID=A0A0D9W290_9ORYZ